MSPTSTQRVFVSDCEGPISKNDNAFELTSHYIPDGSRFFTVISRYDDVLADVVKRKGYKAGDTLKLILPFLKAYGASNQGIRAYSSKHIILVPGTKETLKFVRGAMPSFIVSTSYEQYMRSLCGLLDFPYENVYCTRLDLDRYEISEKEREQLDEFKEEISKMPMIEIQKGVKSISDLQKEHRRAIKRLDEIFWKEIPSMDVGKILREVNPVGGFEKAKALQDVGARLNCDLCDVMYVGDSITDVSVFRMVREAGGLTVSFNGNEYAVREAEVAVLSRNSIVTSILADVFNRFGKEEAVSLVEEWSPLALKKHHVDSALQEGIVKLYPKRLPQVEKISPENMTRLTLESSAFRKSVRGEAIGRLG